MHVVAILLLVVATAAAFSPVGNQGQRNALGTELKMGFLDGLFGPKSAEASHILLTGPNASARCENLKMEIYKKAVGGGELSGGIEAEKLMSAFAQQAKKSSTCPSRNKGGALGSFGPGQMVPEFDQVAFKEQVGVIHGPVETSFGSHLILITDRE